MKEILPDKASCTPLWPFLGVWEGHLFHGACPKAHLPFGALPGQGRESLCWEELVGEYKLPPTGDFSPRRLDMRRWEMTSPFLKPCLRVLSLEA